MAGIDWSWLALDGAMAKARRVGEKAGRNPTDRGQLETKRSLLTDGRGVPPALAGTSRNDHKLMGETLAAIPVGRPKPTPDEPRALALEFGFTLHLRTRGEEIQAKCLAGTKAGRRVVERTHSWRNRFRRILLRRQKRPDADLARLHVAPGLITCRHAGPMG